MKIKQTNMKDYIHGLGHNHRLLLKILLQILAIDKYRVHLPIQILEMISVVAKIFTNKKCSNPKGLKFSVFPFLFMGFIPLHY